MVFSGFSIHASGVPEFLYSRQNCADGTEFEATAIMSALQASGPSAVGVASGVADYVLPSVASEVRSGAQQAGEVIWAQRMRDEIRRFTRHPEVAGGWISVSAIQSNFIGQRTASDVATYRFIAQDDDAAVNFMRRILPVLTNTSMNNYGVLREIWSAMANFRITLDGNFDSPMLSIQLHG